MNTDAAKTLENKNIKLIPLAQLEEQGKNAQIGTFISSFNGFLPTFLLFDLDEDVLKIRPKKEDIAVIMYTSGSTGPPKGWHFFIE